MFKREREERPKSLRPPSIFGPASSGKAYLPDVGPECLHFGRNHLHLLINRLESHGPVRGPHLERVRLSDADLVLIVLVLRVSHTRRERKRERTIVARNTRLRAHARRLCEYDKILEPSPYSLGYRCCFAEGRGAERKTSISRY